jgi:hypothetical protein
MASIDANLHAPLAPDPTFHPAQTQTTSPIDTILAPVPFAPTILPGEEKLTAKDAAKANKQQQAEDKEAFRRQGIVGKQYREDEKENFRRQEIFRQQEEGFQAKQQNLLSKGVGSAVGAVGSIKNGVGRISMPGGLLLPVLTLLILFFLIVPVNGNTRAAWLWLVLSGNASINGDAQGGSSGEASSNVSPATTSTTASAAIVPATASVTLPTSGNSSYSAMVSGEMV